MYLHKYGYNTPWNSDLEEGQEVADNIDPDVNVDALDPEEVKECAVYFKKLQEVTIPSHRMRCMTDCNRKLESGIILSMGAVSKRKNSPRPLSGSSPNPS